MTKMGMHNIITEERFKKAKAELKSSEDDERVMKKYGFGKTTSRRIRGTDNYYEYRKKGDTEKAKREHLQSVLSELQEDDGARNTNSVPSLLTKTTLDDYKLEYEQIHGAIIRPLVFAIVVLVVMIFVMGGTAILIMGGR